MIDRFLRKLSVRTRIVGGFLILIALLTLGAPLSVANYNFLVERLQQVTNIDAAANQALLLASTRIANSRVNLMRYIDNQVPSPVEALDDTDAAAALLNEVLTQGWIGALDQQQTVATVVRALADYKTLITDIEAARQQSSNQDNARQIFQAYRLGNDTGQRIEQIVKDSEDRILAANATVEADAQGRLWFLTGSYMVAVVLGLILTLLLQRSITRPVASLRNAAEAFRQGQFDTTIAVTGSDELSLLAQTFNQMTAELARSYLDLEQRVAVRTDQLRASAEVGRVATSILNSDQLLEQVANLITIRFGFYYTAVFTLDEQGQFALLRAATGEAGRILLERHHRLPVNTNSMVGAAILTQHPRIALDVGEGAVRFANPLLPNTRSEISLPLRVGERVIGALNVQSEEAGAFDEARAEVLQAMADQIAVALFNAESFNRSEDQARALGLLNQLSRDLAQATARENVAFAVAQTVMKLIGPDRMALIETTPNPQLLSARTLWADANRPLGIPQPISASSSLSGDCLKRGETIYLPDVTTMLDQYEDVAVVYALGVRSSAAIPLRIGDRIIGTFNVASDRADAYTTEQLAQLEQVAAQVALTLDGLNSAKQTQQALTELDAANRRLVGQAWTSYTQLGGLVAAEWRNGQWNTTRQREARVEGASSQALVSAAQAINLPIKVRGETIGEFSVAPDKGQADWNSEDVAFAQALIDQVGQVLENARLLEETERSAQREKAVAGAAEKIHRATDIETVLQSAISELNRITGRRGISVQLGFGHAEVQRPSEGNGHGTDAEGDR